MDTISYFTFRAQLASILDKVNDNHKPILDHPAKRLARCGDEPERLSGV